MYAAVLPDPESAKKERTTTRTITSQEDKSVDSDTIKNEIINAVSANLSQQMEELRQREDHRWNTMIRAVEDIKRDIQELKMSHPGAVQLWETRGSRPGPMLSPAEQTRENAEEPGNEWSDFFFFKFCRHTS
jgi:hypothetical protein